MSKNQIPYLVLLLLLFTSSFVLAQTDIIHVTNEGSNIPNGSSSNPFYIVESGICAVSKKGNLFIRNGEYFENLLIQKPVLLNAIGGDVKIGGRKEQSQTSFKVLTYNTHLFGDEGLGFGPDFADEKRALEIANAIKNENVDIICLQEVWDEEFAEIIINTVKESFPFVFYSNNHDNIGLLDLNFSVLNSGLMLLSRIPLTSPPRLEFYEEEDGNDTYASKGFISTIIRKDSFQFGIFFTHMQAHEDTDAMESRHSQIQQLNSAISDFRRRNPEVEVIVAGDFNVIENDPEFNSILLPILNLNEAFRNTPCYDNIQNKFTVLTSNELVQIFDPELENSQRLDYIFYSQGNSFHLYPTHSEVKKYESSTPICDIIGSPPRLVLKCVNDLSDHLGLLVHFIALK